jgi:hypothetical protein
MKLLIEDKKNLLKRLPVLKLSYENIHKKVCSDMYFLIPKGKKHIVWFTYIKDKKVCIFIEINPGSKKLIKNIYEVPQTFEKKIVLGTIFYGTLFMVKEKKLFSIENIHFYKGKNIENNTELFKLELLNNILSKEIKQIIIGKYGIGLGIPAIENSFEQSLITAKQLPYDIYSIQSRNIDNTNNLYNSTIYKNYDISDSKYIFSVKADIQNDIYDLYAKNRNNILEKFDIAAIPTYEISIMMNKLFRNIKENFNLDALEESDDEDEFENINEDKFVDLDKCVKIECIFNKRFNKYVPIKVVQDGNIVFKHSIESKY